MLRLKHFRHYYLKYAYAFILGVLILILLDWYQLEIPRLLKVIIDGIDENTLTSINDVTPILLTVILLVSGITIGRFLWRYLLIGTSRKIETDIRREMFKKATTLDQSFYINEKTGGLMAYFVNDLNSVRELFGFGLLMLVDGLVLGTFVLIRMFRLDWVMTLYAFIPIALMGILIFFLQIRMEQKFKLRQEAFENMSDFTQESYSGIAVIKAYVREAKEALQFRKKSEDVYDKSMSHMHYAILVNIIIDVMISLVIIAILSYGALLIAKNELTGGELTEYISYFFTLLWPVFALASFLNINGQAQASAKRIYNFLETTPSVKKRDDALKDFTLDGAITFKNLSFTYPDAMDAVLKDISFNIKPGELVGILGKTGSGKSTLVELLLNVYNTTPGMIYFDEYDINDLNVEALRNYLGYVPQDNFLFSTTIASNIAFAAESADLSEIIAVAKLSDIHENVSEFKEGYDTILGERGVTVSGGQKQRISIARALFKDPTILILDDSVSAVDTKTEEAIINNLRTVRKGKTTLLIAHRISTVKRLDKIALFDNGTLSAFGSHDELLKTSSLYQNMVALQDLERLVEEV